MCDWLQLLMAYSSDVSCGQLHPTVAHHSVAQRHAVGNNFPTIADSTKWKRDLPMAHHGVSQRQALHDKVQNSRPHRTAAQPTRGSSRCVPVPGSP
jgi:hypothetical protein